MRLIALALLLLIPLVSLAASTLTPSSEEPNAPSIDTTLTTVPLSTPTSNPSLTTVPHHDSTTGSTEDYFTDTQSSETATADSDLSMTSPEFVHGLQLNDSSLNQTGNFVDSLLPLPDNQSLIVIPPPVVPVVLPPPSQLPGGSSQKAPSAVASASESDDAPSKSTPEVGELPLDELKTQRDLALEHAKKANETFQTASGKLKDKEDLALQANQTYEEKKGKWEGLEKIVVEKKEAWMGPLITAKAEFKIADDFFESAKANFTKAETALNNAQNDFKTANEKLAEIEGRPERLRLAGLKETANTDRTKTVNGLKITLTPEFTKLQTAYNTAKETADDKTSKYNDGKCDELTFKETAACVKLREAKAIFDGLLTAASELFVPVNTTMSGYDTELETLKLELPTIEEEIRIVKQLIRTQGPSDVDNAKNVVKIYKGDVELAQPIYDAAKPIFEDAKTDFGKKTTTRDSAQAIVDQGEPPELITAKDQADDAHVEEVKAGNELRALNGEVESLKNEVSAAQTLYTQAQSDADSLALRYDTAKRRDDEAKRGLSSATIGLIVSFVIAAIVAAAIVVVCWMKRLFCFQKLKQRKQDGKPNGGPSVGAKKSSKRRGKKAMSRTPSTSNTALPSISQVSARPGDEATPTPDGAAQLPADGAQLGYPTPQVMVVNYDIYGPEPPPIEGVHYKATIYSKDMPWKGPMTTRTTRWHGAPDHDMEGVEGVKKVDKITFDKNGNTATEIGESEILKNTGPASDSSRSEFLNNLDDWEAKHKIYMAELAAKKGAAGGGGATAGPASNPSTKTKTPASKIAEEKADKKSKKEKKSSKK